MNRSSGSIDIRVKRLRHLYSNLKEGMTMNRVTSVLHIAGACLLFTVGVAQAEGESTPPGQVQERAVPGSRPTPPLSGLEAALQRDLNAMRQELQRLDSALQNPAVAPSAAVSASVPRLQGILRAVTSTVAALKAQATNARDAAGTNRALVLEQQGQAIQQRIGALPADAAGPDVELARKKCRASGERITYMEYKMKEVLISS